MSIPRCMYICAMLLLLSGWGASDVFADVPAELRANFSEFLHEQCHTSLQYSLDDTFGESADRYHETINCIFRDGSVRMMQQVNADVTPILREIPSPYTPPDPQVNSGDCALSSIQSRQGEFASQCAGGPSDSAFSSCRVAETALNEYCAYRQYLYYKSQDETSFFEEESFATPLEAVSLRNGRIQYFRKEEKDSERALQATIEYYKDFESSYETFVWLSALRESLLATRSLMVSLRTNFNVLPAKFENASSRICDQ